MKSMYPRRRGRAVAHASRGALVVCALLASKTAFATTYQVGPDRAITSLDALSSSLAPGDIVEVDGAATYAGGIVMESSGTLQNPVIIRGVTIDGKRPILSGGDQTIVFDQDHVVFENFEVTGGAASCIVHKGDDITLRHVVVHDCMAHGILGTDMYAGSQTLEFVEVYATGAGDYKHQIYLATDNTLHPDARVRIQHCYIHDAAGGHNVKSRAGRNEIYENWIEGPGLHVLDLIGADGQDPDLVREDSDVVGNVLIQSGIYAIARIGGDGTGASSGRYRFAYNTIVMSGLQGDAFRLQDQIESLSLVSNVFVAPDGGSPTLVELNDPVWASGAPRLSGQNNFVQSGLSPAAFFTGTVAVGDPGFANFAGEDLAPALGSPLIDAGSTEIGPSGYAIPNPLVVPTFVPTRHGTAPHVPIPRPFDGAPDIGAYERDDDSGSAPGGATSGAGGAGAGDPVGQATSASSGGGTGGSDLAGDDDAEDDQVDAGGQCTYAPGPGSSSGLLAGAAALLAALARRARRHARALR